MYQIKFVGIVHTDWIDEMSTFLGYCPVTQCPVYWGDGIEIACLIEDRDIILAAQKRLEEEDLPF